MRQGRLILTGAIRAQKDPNEGKRVFAKPLDLRTASDAFKARFWSKVSIGEPGECWEWLAYRKPTGYGQFTLRKGVFLTASRVALALSGVVLEENQVACHRCDNPPCVNPAHLFVGDQVDNTLDCISKGRANRATGEAHPSARLTANQVRQIRAEPKWYGVYAYLGHEYGISANAVRRIRDGRTWKEIA